MTRTTVMTIAAIVAGAALAADGGPARAQGGRVLSVGGTSVVVARPTGRYQLAQVPRPGAVPQFHSLSPQARGEATRVALETVQAAAPGAAVNKLAELTGGVTLVATRAIRVPATTAVRTASVPATFRPLARPARDAILQAASTETGTTETPAATQPGQVGPFTLTPQAMNAPNKGYIHIDNAQFFGGAYGFISFSNGTGSVRVVAAGSTAKQHMLHFQVFNPTGAAYDYSLMSCDGTTTKVSARSSGVQDIVVFCMLPQNAPMNPTLASVTGGAAQWYFMGVEVTPM